MITVLKSEKRGSETLYQFIGTSDDTKPTTGVCNGSSFIEMNTGFTSYFDADTTTWTSAPEE